MRTDVPRAPLNDSTKPFSCGLLARCNAIRLQRPGTMKKGMTGQLRAIVADHHSSQPATLSDGRQLRHDTLALQRGIDEAAQAFSAVVVDEVDQSETPGSG